jgi:hypothetical protein
MQRVPVGIGVDGNGGDVGLGAGAYDAYGDFAAVGDQYLVDQGVIPPEPVFCGGCLP